MIRSLNAIPALRLHNQCLSRASHRQAADLVAWLGAVQAQEFGPAKWALGLRLPPTSTDTAVEEDARAHGAARGQDVVALSHLVSYRDRVAVPHGPTKVHVGTRGSVLFQHALVIAGQVAGTWRAGQTASAASIDVIPLRRLTKIEKGRLDSAVARYSRFRGGGRHTARLLD